MKTGTKSLLFGVHQFAWHPITVLIAWIVLYRKFPTWRELICIVIHDWGYWGCEKMDDERGELHPIKGAMLARKYLDGVKDGICQACKDGGSMSCWENPEKPYGKLILLHSRHLSHKLDRQPSRLCWPDKLSIIYDPGWFYLLRANLSGEIHEFIANGENYNGRKMTQREWMKWLKTYLKKVAKEKLGAQRSSSKLNPYKV